MHHPMHYTRSHINYSSPSQPRCILGQLYRAEEGTMILWNIRNTGRRLQGRHMKQLVSKYRAWTWKMMTRKKSSSVKGIPTCA